MLEGMICTYRESDYPEVAMASCRHILRVLTKWSN